LTCSVLAYNIKYGFATYTNVSAIAIGEGGSVAHAWSHEKRGMFIMLGIEDPWIIAGYVLMFGSALACVIYGILKWNVEEE
jgi:hypothetical protein